MEKIQTDLECQPFNPRIIVFGVVSGVLAMLALGGIIISQFCAVQLREAGNIGSVYINGFLTSYAEEAYANGAISPESQAELSKLIDHLSPDRGFEKLRIWSVDEMLWFDSDHAGIDEGHDDDDLLEAISGRAVAVLEMPSERGDGERTISHPYIEIYAPLFGTDPRKVFAVGEIYQDARPLLAERSLFERKVWGAVSFATLGFIALMILIARQHRQLVINLDRQRDISSQNQQLRQAAENAWQSSGQAHEAMLNHLGAELHDGPVQMLSLLALIGTPKAAGAEPAKPSVQGIAQDVLEDLRRISAGLILPELGHLSLRDTVMLAVSRHASTTGTEVTHEFGLLPESADDLRKTCIYRVVQEGLNNAYRHGSGFGQHVTAQMENGDLHVKVSNKSSGPTESAGSAAPLRNTGLGIIGLRNRLKVFGGTLDTVEIVGGGFVLSASLPLA